MVAALLWALLCAAAPPVSFVPAGPRFVEAADEYRRLWEREGERIVAALESASGRTFPAGRIEAIVSASPPMASYDGRTIRLKAGYPRDYMRATLVHELGHRLALTLPENTGLDDHQLLYLFLHDAWTELYGRDFADLMVWIERQIPGAYNYDAAWDWALSMTPEQRRARLETLRWQSPYRFAEQQERARGKPQLDFDFTGFLPDRPGK